MRILQISHNHHVVGGSDAVFLATSALLTKAGHEVIPFCIRSADDRPSKWRKYFPAGADTGRAPASDLVRYFFNTEARANLIQLLDEAGPVDVAHLHIYHGKQTPAILPILRARGIPVVQTLHEYKLCCPVYTMLRDGKPCELCVQGSTLNCLRHRCKDGSLARSGIMVAEMATSRLLGDVRLVDRFLCVSAFQRKLMEQSGIPARKLYTLHNFVETPEFPTEPGHDGYLLYFGRIEELKGLPTLIEAVRQCGTRLLIAGDGNWRQQMVGVISSVPNIEYLGFQTSETLDRLIGRAMAVVVPSEWYENCPMSVLEAKTQGRPVIGARIGGIPELVRDGIDGFLFEPGNTTDLSLAIRAVAAADFPALSANARADVESRFSASAHLTALLGHYGKLKQLNKACLSHFA